MDHAFHEPLLKPRLFKHDDCKKLSPEMPEKLLEYCWFFGNIFVLHTNNTTIMSKIAPDSNFVTSSNSMSQLAIKSRKSHEETYESIVKRSEESWPSNLIRAPSLPPRADGINEPTGRRKSNMNTSSSDLIGGSPPIMATSQKGEDVQDEEVEFSMGKLIRQASLSNSESFPPRRRPAKKTSSASSGLSRHGSIMKTDVAKLEGPEKMVRPQHRMNQLKTQKSLNDLELYHELRGFKDLGLDSETSPRPDGKKSAEDIKAQIKFWARAVASNVRQES